MTSGASGCRESSAPSRYSRGRPAPGVDTWALLRFLLGFPGFLWPFGQAFYAGIAVVTWLFLQPGAGQIEAFSTLKLAWILPTYVRNFAFLVLVAGAWHLRLYWMRAQGTPVKYNGRWRHRYFDCNYGNDVLPLDRWFGTIHDGSPQSYQRLRARRGGQR